jgi:anti-sigma B factor antagonist
VPDFEILREGDAAVVASHGDVLSSSVPQMRVAMRDLVRSGVREMIFDLDKAAMIDSTGLGLLLAAFNSITAVGGKFSVVHASDEILDLFRTMRIHQHFTVSGR